MDVSLTKIWIWNIRCVQSLHPKDPPKAHASLDLSWRRRAPREWPWPQVSPQHADYTHLYTITIHIFFDTARRPAIITVPERNHFHVLASEVEPEIRPDALLASNWASIESLKTPRHCPDCTLCRTSCRPMQGAATSGELATWQHAGENIANDSEYTKSNQTKVILWNPVQSKPSKECNSSERIMFFSLAERYGTIS